MGATLTITIEDQKRKKGTLSFYLHGSLTAAQQVARAQGIATAVNALTNGAIRSMSIVQKVALPGGLRTVPTANSDVEVQARFLGTSINGKAVRWTVPAYDEGSTLPSSDKLDPANGDVTAFVAHLLSNEVADNFDSTIETVDAMYEHYSKGTGES